MRFCRLPRMRALLVLAAFALLAASNGAQASFLDDRAAFGAAVEALRSAIGEHPRVLRIEVEADHIAIEAQDPRNRNHVDRWQYAVINVMRVLSLKRLSGPQAVEPHLVNPDLEANLFDLDAVDLSAMPKLTTAAIARAGLQDKALVTRVEIARQTFILPEPTSGDIRWTLTVASGRERAEIYANAQGAIVGADLGSTRRAQTLNLFDQPALVADAAAAFRAGVGAEAVLRKVEISDNRVAFFTNIPDDAMAKLRLGVPGLVIYTWDLNGLHRRLGDIDTDAMMKNVPPPAFSVDEVNWKLLAQLAPDALARAAIPKSKLTEVDLAKSTAQPGGPVLLWTVEITQPNGERTSVIADAQGAIKRVALPASRQPKTDWLDAATIADAIARIAPTFGADAKIASIVFNDRGARITLDERDNGNRPATFDFSSDGVARATISFMLDSMGPRYGVADLAPLNEQAIAALEAQALKRLGANQAAWLESVTIGANPFVRQAGGRAIEVRVRDREVDSVQANYAWIVFDFTGRVLDLSTF